MVFDIRQLLCALVHYYSLLPDLPEGHNNLLLGTKLCLFQFSRSASVLFYFESHSQAGSADAGAIFGFARLPAGVESLYYSCESQSQAGLPAGRERTGQGPSSQHQDNCNKDESLEDALAVANKPK